jgi:hypothetical protein
MGSISFVSSVEFFCVKEFIDNAGLTQTINVSGHTERKAPVHPSCVPAFTSACVAISTLPATVVEAFGVVLVPASFHTQL